MPTETMDQPVVAQKSFMDSAEFDTPLLEALASTEKLRAEAAGEVPAPAAIAAVPEVKPAEMKPADAKPAKPADEEAIPEDIKSPQGQSSWKKIKEAKVALEKERDDFRGKYDGATKRIEELEKAAKTPAQQSRLEDNPEYVQLKALAEAKEKQLEEYSQQLRMIDVEQHPKFKAYFENKINAQMAMAKNVGGDKALEILKLPPGEYKNNQLEELAAELSPMKAAQLASVLTRLEEIHGERAGEVAEAKANYNQILAEQKQQAEQKRAATENVFKQVTADVRDKAKGLTVFHEREGDEGWNKGVQERLAIAQNAFSGKLDPEAAARAVYWAAAAPTFLVQLNGALEKNAALEKEIASLRAVAPNPGGARPGETDATAPTGKTGLDAQMDAMQSAFQPVR